MKGMFIAGILLTGTLTHRAALAQEGNASPATVTSAASPADIATEIATKVFPNGTYRKIMSGTFDKLMNSMMDQMGTLPVRDLAQLGGVDAAKLATIDKATLADVMAILDPAFKERSHIMIQTMMREMVPIMEKYEPNIREGLADAYRQRFSAAQLGELNRFFDTPTGSAYASQQMMMFADPAVMSKMQAFLPDFMKVMPSLMTKVQTATAGLPKAKTYKDLTAAERDKLARLLGVDPKTLKK